MKNTLILGLLSALFLVVWSGGCATQPAANTATPVETPLPAPTSAPASLSVSQITPLPTVTYEQLLGVHESVLETTRWSVTAVLSVVTVLSCISGMVLSALTIIGGATGLVAYSRVSDAVKRADATKNIVDKLQLNVDNLEQQTQDAFESAKEITGISKKVQKKLTESQKEIKTMKVGFKGDIDVMRNSLLLVQIEERSIELYSDEPEVQKRAIQAVKVMAFPERPAFIRRHAVALLGNYAADYGDAVVAEWIEVIARDDLAASVRRTAQYELNKFKHQNHE